MEQMILHEDRISGDDIFHGRVVNLKVDQIRLPNGHTASVKSFSTQAACPLPPRLV